LRRRWRAEVSSASAFDAITSQRPGDYSGRAITVTDTITVTAAVTVTDTVTVTAPATNSTVTRPRRGKIPL